MSEASGGRGGGKRAQVQKPPPSLLQKPRPGPPPCPLPPCRTPWGRRGQTGADSVPSSAAPADNNTARLNTQPHTNSTRADTHTEGHLGGGGSRLFFFLSFFFFFFLFTLQKERASSVELMKELTNITKILQLVKISSTLSFYEQGGDPGCRGRRESERCQLGLRNSLIFFFPSPPKLNDILLLKYCLLGFTDPLRAASPPFFPDWGREP